MRLSGIMLIIPLINHKAISIPSMINTPLKCARAAEAAFAPFRIFQTIHKFKFRGDDGHDHKLCDLLSLFHYVCFSSVVKQDSLNASDISAINRSPACDAFLCHQATFGSNHANKSFRDCHMNACVNYYMVIRVNNRSFRGIMILSIISKPSFIA